MLLNPLCPIFKKANTKHWSSKLSQHLFLFSPSAVGENIFSSSQCIYTSTFLIHNLVYKSDLAEWSENASLLTKSNQRGGEVVESCVPLISYFKLSDVYYRPRQSK